MKLAVLGGLTVALGLALTETGLIAIGAFWVLLGSIMRLHGRRVLALKGGDAELVVDGKPVVDARTFAVGTLLWFVLGVPSLLVGLLELGITSDHTQWRWLPLVVGALALGVGGISGVLYLLGTAVSAKAQQSPRPTIPATITIRSAAETGTFINERPRLSLELLVEPERGSAMAAYEVTKLATVPYTALGSLGVGDGFRALVHGPDRPTVMDIHWDHPIAGRTTSAPSGEVPARLAELDELHRAGQVSDEEYRAQRERILGSL